MDGGSMSLIRCLHRQVTQVQCTGFATSCIASENIGQILLCLPKENEHWSPGREIDTNTLWLVWHGRRVRISGLVPKYDKLI